MVRNLVLLLALVALPFSFGCGTDDAEPVDDTPPAVDTGEPVDPGTDPATDPAGDDTAAEPGGTEY